MESTVCQNHYLDLEDADVGSASVTSVIGAMKPYDAHIKMEHDVTVKVGDIVFFFYR